MGRTELNAQLKEIVPIVYIYKHVSSVGGAGYKPALSQAYLVTIMLNVVRTPPHMAEYI